MTSSNRDRNRWDPTGGHHDVAFHHDSAAYHHAQASQHREGGNHDWADRHGAMADYHSGMADRYGQDMRYRESGHRGDGYPTGGWGDRERDPSLRDRDEREWARDDWNRGARGYDDRSYGGERGRMRDYGSDRDYGYQRPTPRAYDRPDGEDRSSYGRDARSESSSRGYGGPSERGVGWGGDRGGYAGSRGYRDEGRDGSGRDDRGGYGASAGDHPNGLSRRRDGHDWRGNDRV